MLIAIERADGGVSIMRIVDGMEQHADDAVEKWKSAHKGQYLSHHEVKESDIPPMNGPGRAAWKFDPVEKKIVIDPVKLQATLEAL